MTEPLTADQNKQQCERCGHHMDYIPYQDAAGCGSVMIEMWRCEQCSFVQYGDTIPVYDACALDNTSTEMD